MNTPADRAVQITSRDNPWVKQLRRLSQDPAAYKKLGAIWVEGEHLCQAALRSNCRPKQIWVAQSAWLQPTPALRDLLTQQLPHPHAQQIMVVADPVWHTFSALESPARIGMVLERPAHSDLIPTAASVVLDRVQDAGNVGSILRSAAAFGFQQVLALKGTAALWSPKVLRAGMGAHFGLRLMEGLLPSDLARLHVPIVATSSHAGRGLSQVTLPWPCAWAFGHEGQGLDTPVASLATVSVRIAQPGGQESLNVAAAAAICLHASVCALTAGEAS